MNKKTRITSVCSLALLCAMLSGCGIWQGMKDGTVEATKSVFYTKLKILKIDPNCTKRFESKRARAVAVDSRPSVSVKRQAKL